MFLRLIKNYFILIYKIQILFFLKKKNISMLKLICFLRISIYEPKKLQYHKTTLPET